MSLSFDKGPESPAANITPSRTVLRSACQAVDPARESIEAAATEAGISLFGTRWSLLDRFERDGRTYVVAARSAFRQLTPREAEIVRLVGLGHTNKVIAYDLGLAWSTVRVLVHRAARKLRARTRTELEVHARRLDPSPMP
jgi:DNA-binding NarL/FixJ family response regulator